MTLKEDQRKIIRHIKGLDKKGNHVIINIINEMGDQLGNLTPICCNLANNPQIIKSLVLWRQRYMEFFFTQFHATFDRTKKWLDNYVIPDDTKILFLVCSNDGKLLGNIGVCNITNKYGELDNVIRGEKVSIHSLFYYSTLTLICWLYNKLCLDTLSLYVLSNNSKAISLYERIGFIKYNFYKLTKITTENEIKYVIDFNKVPLENEIGCIKMVLQKNKFYSLAPWLIT